MQRRIWIFFIRQHSNSEIFHEEIYNVIKKISISYKNIIKYEKIISDLHTSKLVAFGAMVCRSNMMHLIVKRSKEQCSCSHKVDDMKQNFEMTSEILSKKRKELVVAWTKKILHMFG